MNEIRADRAESARAGATPCRSHRQAADAVVAAPRPLRLSKTQSPPRLGMTTDMMPSSPVAAGEAGAEPTTPY